MTTGAISHYFRSKEDIINYTFKTRTQSALDQIAERAQGVAPGLERLRIALKYMLPISGDTHGPQGTAGAIVSYWGLAVSEPRFRDMHQASYARWYELLTVYLEEARERGLVRPAIDISLTASRLMTLADGIVVADAIEPSRMTQPMALRIIEEEIESLQTPAA